MNPKINNPLGVVFNNNKYIPEINNLGENSHTFDNQFNAQLLELRRKALSPYHHFPTKEQLSTYNVSLLSNSDISNATQLKENMFIAMDKNCRKICEAFGGFAAHHIVEGNDSAAEGARSILKKFNIKINHPENGIFLPTDPNSIFKGTEHYTSHSSEYSPDFVNASPKSPYFSMISNNGLII